MKTILRAVQRGAARGSTAVEVGALWLVVAVLAPSRTSGGKVTLGCPRHVDTARDHLIGYTVCPIF